MKGSLYLRINNIPRAFKNFAEALAIDPKNQDAILAIGSILQENNQNDNALIKYRIAMYYNQNSSKVWNNIGFKYNLRNGLLWQIKFCSSHKLFEKSIVFRSDG